MTKRKIKIGLALGGGGAKGIAHVGILNVFEKYGIEIASIAGTSVGSIIGGGYALGMKAEELLRRGAVFNSKKFVRISNFNFFSDSLIKDKDINKAIMDILEEKTFEDIKIPFLATAVDLESGKEVILKEGKLWEAARASSAIPFIFSPVFLNGRYLVDGGLLNNVPVDHLREQNDLDIIIGIEIGGLTSRQYISGIVWEKYFHKPEAFKLYPSFFTRMKINTTMLAHIMLRAIDIMRESTQYIRYEKAKPDILIKPSLENISLLDFDRYQEAYSAGIKAAESEMPKILALIDEKKKLLNQ